MITDHVLISKILLYYMLYVFHPQGRLQSDGQGQEDATMNSNPKKEVSSLPNTDSLVGDGGGGSQVWILFVINL
jgi:hypothetical protein